MKNWKINSMLTKPSFDNLQDVVVAVDWTREAIRTVNGVEYKVSCYGLYNCPNPKSNDFIPYQNLTKQQVENWLNIGLNVTEIDLRLETQLDEKINPSIVKLPLPF